MTTITVELYPGENPASTRDIRKYLARWFIYRGRHPYAYRPRWHGRRPRHRWSR